MDLGQIPWGPFDALGKRLSLLLPSGDETTFEETGSESQVERALRHVEHAADRCGEFAQLSNGNQELWLRSQETWEFIRRYLTSLWIDTEVDGRSVSVSRPTGSIAGNVPPQPTETSVPPPTLPGAASTLRVAATALKATPLAHWREAVDASDPEAPTREEAVQTLLGVARILSGQIPADSVVEGSPRDPDAPLSGQPSAPAPEAPQAPAAVRDEPPPTDPDQLSFEFAQGYDEGYQMGRKVGLALGARRGGGNHPPKS
jgi:hypothetical protein